MPCPCLMKCWQKTYQMVCLSHPCFSPRPKPPRSPSPRSIPQNPTLSKEEVQLQEILETFEEIELQEVKIQS